ncbi:MAG: hypothetical protein Q4F45_05010, partial [Alistipes sp.]|nr:hypothetical protein [Alistipes sp.]
VAEFLAAPVDATKMYELTGVITRVANTTYGNFDLTDETGTVYIYGLNSPENVEKYWAASGAKLGDTITVQTVRAAFNGTAQGDHALFVSLVPFVAQASEWGLCGDLNGWAAPDVALMTTWKSDKLFVAENVNIASGSFKIRANNEWNDAKNYGLSVAGKIYADKYYSLLNGAGSQNATPMDYGTYDVWFDLENERVALMTPGKDYAEAEDGGEPVVVIEGLTDHTWGMIGSFAASNNWNADVAMVIEGDYAVAKNVTLANGNEFKFRADGAWTLSYGSACDVNVGEVYKTYNNGNNMKFVGEDGAYDIYFSMVDASFYLKAHASATVATWEADAQGWANQKVVKDTAWAIDENVTVTFKQGKAGTAPTYYTSGNAVRLYQNGAIMEIAAANNMTIKSIQLSFANNQYYIAADSGDFSAEGATRTWTGEAEKVLFTTTGTDKDHRAYVTAIEVTYE